MISLRRLARVDLPEAPRPRITTRFMLFSVRPFERHGVGPPVDDITLLYCFLAIPLRRTRCVFASGLISSYFKHEIDPSTSNTASAT